MESRYSNKNYEVYKLSTRTRYVEEKSYRPKLGVTTVVPGSIPGVVEKNGDS